MCEIETRGGADVQIWRTSAIVLVQMGVSGHRANSDRLSREAYVLELGSGHDANDPQATLIE